MAMDRETIAKTIFGSDYSHNGVIPAALGSSALTWDQLGEASQWYKYNPDEFARLAAGAGWHVDQVWTDDRGLFSVQYLTVDA